MASFPPSHIFPSAEEADEQGVVGVGGMLSPEWIVEAYTHGIFPWPMDGLLVWASPDPRGVIELDGLHVSRSLRRSLRRGRYTITRDRCFRQVITRCAQVHGAREGTWITPDMIGAYCQLHARGVAHSVEAWLGPELVGGVYGVALGSMFAAESMFHTATDASKVALVHLVEHLRSRGYTLFDVQVTNAHTESLGARNIPRAEFFARVQDALSRNVTFDDPARSIHPHADRE